jgi:hypothetical protein
MAPHYPRPSDTLSPFRSRPELILAPCHPMRRKPKEESVLQPLVTAAAAILLTGMAIWPASAAIAYVVALIH